MIVEESYDPEFLKKIKKAETEMAEGKKRVVHSEEELEAFLESLWTIWSFSPTAEKDIIFLKKSEPQAFKKLEKLLKELRIHPFSGTGKPELLKYDLKGYWSRRITHKHRLVYQVDEEKILVMLVSAQGHYFDK